MRDLQIRIKHSPSNVSSLFFFKSYQCLFLKFKPNSVTMYFVGLLSNNWYFHSFLLHCCFESRNQSIHQTLSTSCIFNAVAPTWFLDRFDLVTHPGGCLPSHHFRFVSVPKLIAYFCRRWVVNSIIEILLSCHPVHIGAEFCLKSHFGF